MTSRLGDCRWPALPPRFDAALREATAFVLDRFDAAGVIASGTIVRGNPDPSSDLDLYVVNRPAVRQRLQRFFGGVPSEIFVNPPVSIRRYFEEEHADGRPVTAHMLATGHVVLAADPIVETLRVEAREWLERVSAPGADEVTRARYGAASWFEDGMDVAEHDPATALLRLSAAIEKMLELQVRVHSGRVPRAKELLAAVRAISPELADQVRVFLLAPSPRDRIEAAGRIADLTLGVRGFFEWESDLQAVDSDTGTPLG